MRFVEEREQHWAGGEARATAVHESSEPGGVASPGGSNLCCKKNGFRIASRRWPFTRAHPYLTGPLRHRGGIVFYSVALSPMFLLSRFLQKRDAKDPAIALAQRQSLCIK